MQLRRSLEDIYQRKIPSVVTLGNFDGIHRGHRHLVFQTIACAKRHHLRSVMLTFDPMPSEFFSPERSPARLMRFNEKWLFLKQFNVDELYVLPFNQALANMSAKIFIEEVLVKHLKVKHIFIGDDFRFGFKREGDVALLKKYGEIFGYSVTTHTEFSELYEPDVGAGGARPLPAVSSTLIREAIQAGNFSLAEKLLGHPYKNIGRVVHGAQLGRQLGCPTANIPMRRKVSPVHGVYVVRVDLPVFEISRVSRRPAASTAEFSYYGVASVGNRPAVGGDPAFLLEVHLFNFEGDLYGKRLEVEYLHKLRDEWMFDSLQALKIQIEKDCQRAKDYLSERKK